MHVSLSELETTLVKAVLAVGPPLGLAEQAGMAVRLAFLRGFDPLPSILQALESRDSGESGGFDMEAAQYGNFRPTQELLSVLSAGPSALDLLVASTPDRPDIVLSALDAPGALVAFSLLAAQQSDANILLVSAERNAKVLCRSWELSLIGGEAAALDLSGPRDIILRRLDASHQEIQMAEPIPSSADKVSREGVDVEPEVWRRVCALAERRLVAGTSTSRLGGAGAGLVDRD